MKTAGALAIQLFAVLAALFLFDAALFRSGWYTRFLNPESSGFYYEHFLLQEQQLKETRQRRVLVFGDSRTGLMARVADERAAHCGLRFGNMSLGGTTPRAWYYLLRDLDPSARAYAAVMIPLERYEDEELTDDYRDRTMDLAYIEGRLRITDVASYTSSYVTPEAKWQALRATVWKGFYYKRDLQQFLQNPKRRLGHIRDAAGWADWVYRYRGENRSLAGLRITWEPKSVLFPPGLDENTKRMIQEIIMADPYVPTGWLAEYRKLWLGRIAARYRNSPTKLIFFRLPRGPIPRPKSWDRNTSSVIGEIARREGSVLSDEHRFEVLEDPKYFVDPLHMNGEGMQLFSQLLADLAIETLQ